MDINILINEVKQKTWLFTDEEIKNKIIEMKKEPKKYFSISPGYVTLFLYKDKGTLSKEEFTSEVMNYLYEYSLDSKEEIDKIVKNNMDLFYTWFNDIENNDYFHAVQWTRDNMISLLHY